MKGLLTRVKGSTPAKVFAAYGEAGASNYATGLAFNGFIAMFPMILGLLSLTGLVIHSPGAEARVQDAVTSIFPGDARGQVGHALQGVRHSAGIMGIVSLLGLIWSGTGLFSGMEFALTQIFGTKQRDALRQRVMGVVMMLIFLAAVIVVVLINSAAALAPALSIVSVVVGAAALTGLLAALYRFVPNRTFTIREVLPGALVGAACIEIFTLLFPLYARMSHGFNTYGQQFALFFVLATWLLFLSQFILLGAVFIRMRVGEPTQEGLVAAPSGDSKDTPRPVDAVKEEKGVASPGGAGEQHQVELDGRRAEHGSRTPLVAIVAATTGVILGRRMGRR
jgi:membrane protein